MGKVTDRGTARVFGPSALLTPANIVTLVRIVCSPIAFTMMITDDNQSSWPLALVWFLLSSSDFVDGTLARKFGTTRSGAFLDPLADKVLVLGGMAAMCWTGRWPWMVFVVIALREVAVSWFRSSYVSRGLAVPASELAKWKTFLQQAAIGWVTLPLTRSLNWLADITLWIGIGLAIVSAAQYFWAGSNAATSMVGDPTPEHKE